MENVFRNTARRVLCSVCAGVLAVSMVPTVASAQPDMGVQAQGQSALTPGVAAPSASGDGGAYATDEILVEYDNSFGSGRARALSLNAMSVALEQEAGLSVVDTVASSNDWMGTVVKAEVPEGMDVDSAVERAKEVPGVAYAQPNFHYELVDGWNEADSKAYRAELATDARDDDGEAATATEGDAIGVQSVEGTNDKYLSKQYYLGSWEEEHGASVVDAWEWARCEDSVTVAVLDTGCAYEHADLKDRVLTDYMWDAWAATTPGTLKSGENDLGDNAGHGTHVCGIVAATADNSVGIAGASYNARILPVKVFDNGAVNPGAETETLVKAYQYLLGLVDKGAIDDLHLVNMSLGGYGDATSSDDLMLKSCIEKARSDYNILTVVAGGNGDRSGNPLTTPCYPSDWDACLSVTATNADGANVHWSDYNMYKDISAPGYDIFSTVPGDYETISMYASLNGTSMASPLVAGCAALLWAAYPALTADEAYDALRSTANPIDPTTEDYHYPSQTGSKGVVDAQAAVQKVMQDHDGLLRVRMKECEVQAIDDQVYTGRSVMPSLTVTYTNDDGVVQTLKEGVDYRVDYRDNKEVGTATAVVIGKGVYIGRNMKDFNIKYDIKTATIAPAMFEYEFTGEKLCPTVRALHRNVALEEGKDFTLDYRNNVSEGEGIIVVTGAGRFMNSIEVPFDIVDSRPSIADAVIAPISVQTYANKPVTPAVTVTLADKKLVSGIDYSVSYTANSKPGYAVAIVKGIGAYRGENMALFQIAAGSSASSPSEPASTTSAKPSLASAKVAVRPRVAYTGKALKPAPKVTLSGKKLRAGRDYAVSYRANKAVGRATVTVTGKGSYTGSKQATFVITPKAPKISKVRGVAGGVSVKWAKSPKATGYQVRVALNKGFKSGKKTVKLKGAKATSKKLSGLKAGKRYYVKVRAFKKVGSKTYYSAWSKVKSVKTKAKDKEKSAKSLKPQAVSSGLDTATAIGITGA